MKNAAIVAEMEAAARDIAAAEEDLGRVLREIKVAPRAEKTTVTEVVESAFTTLRAARARLARLEEALRCEEGD